jgi:hypothetical protein
MESDTVVPKVFKRFWASLQNELDTAAQHHHARSVLQELPHVGNLNAGDMWVPVSLQSHARPPAGPEFEVPSALKPTGFDRAPFEVIDPR